MASSTILTFFLLLSSLLLLLNPPKSKLTLDYYKHSCPQFSQIIQGTITNKPISTPTTASATLRLFFHDCLTNGSDASVLVSSTFFYKAERDADINLSLLGDGFGVVVRAKTALELACPNTVSCADILAVATCDLLAMLGGPHYAVFHGRNDARVSKASSVDGRLPKPSMSMSKIIEIFTSRGFFVEEMVDLSGAHTIGVSHCSEISRDIYNNSQYSEYDTEYDTENGGGCHRDVEQRKQGKVKRKRRKQWRRRVEVELRRSGRTQSNCVLTVQNS